MAKLKVFRTAAGFYDAYVAAPSRKAALAAWGADKDLFARGVAEEVTDPVRTAAPLARPGEVVKVSRGSRDEQLAALPEVRTKRRAEPAPAREPARGRESKPKPKSAPKPKPSRDALDTAEQALAEAEARHEGKRAALAEEEAALERRKREAKRAQEAEVAGLERARAAAESEYRAALAAWRRDAAG